RREEKVPARDAASRGKRSFLASHLSHASIVAPSELGRGTDTANTKTHTGSLTKTAIAERGGWGDFKPPHVATHVNSGTTASTRSDLLSEAKRLRTASSIFD
ncbi:hypothetical protein CSUI_000197, partial [Cystoisospora suis]